jgi:hypothetical protein
MYVVEPRLFYIHRQSGPAAFQAHRDPLPAAQPHHHSGKVHKGVYLHACDIAWQPKSGQLNTNYCHCGA